MDNLKDLKPKTSFGIRHLQTLMLFVGTALVYGLRANMSVAIVAMTDTDDPNAFDWSIQTQSMILSSFFWGYAILQIPAGEIAARFGGSILILISIGINSATSLMIPIAAHYGDWRAVCGCRVLQGLTQGLAMPAVYHMIGKWIPLEEKSLLGALIFAGAQIGMAVQLVSSGYIAQYWGWPAIFYFNGALGVIWTAFYLFLGADSPEVSKMISDDEKLYIQTSLGQVGKQKKLKTPWKCILSSLPFLSLMAVHSAQSWGFWTLMTEMPSYFKQVLHVDIKSNGLISALPYLAQFILSFPFGYLSDYVLRKGYLSVTATRKLSNSIGQFGPAVALVGLSYSPAGSVGVAAALLTTVVGLNAGVMSGFMLVHIDMSPNFAGTLMGITNCLASLVSIIAPLAAGLLLQDETNADDWRKVFYTASALYIMGNTTYLVFGTSEKQKWNETGSDCDHGVKPETNIEKTV